MNYEHFISSPWIFTSFICFFIYLLSFFKFQIKYSWLFKVCSIVFLGIYSIYHIHSKYIELVYISIFLSALGDFWLGINEKNFFLHGLISFLFAHVCSSIFFFCYYSNNQFFMLTNKIIISLLFLFSIIFYKILSNYLGKLKISVIIYIIGLLSLNISAILSKFSCYELIIGVLLFTLSDSVIAYQKFKYNFKLANQIVWVSYYFAQFLIVFSLKQS